MRTVKRAVLIFGLFLVLFGCRKSSDANWDVDLSIPVVNSLLSIKNFVNDSLFQADNTGLLYVHLNREIAYLKLDSLIALPDTSVPDLNIVNLFPGALELTLNNPPTTLPPADLRFDIPNGILLNRADIREGLITVKFTNKLSQPLDLIYQIKAATKNGQSFTIKETIPTGANGLTKTYDLSEYSLDLRGTSGTDHNMVTQTYTFGLSASASNSTTVSAFDTAAVLKVSYSKLVPSYAEGYFGNQVIDIAQDTAKLGLTDNFTASNFMLSDATMDFSIVNELGAEFRASLSNIKSINSVNNNVVALNTNQLSTINIDRAKWSGGLLKPGIRVISFNPANSNITGFISNLPDKLTYKGSVQVNPIQNFGNTDFAYYNTGIRILANISIPLKFAADYFELRSTTDVDFSGVDQLNKVNYGNFVISASNGFPFAVRLQGYMYDDQNVMIDSLFVPGSNVIDAGALNNANEVTVATQKKVQIPMGRSKIENLKKCKKIRMVSRFIMPNNPPDIKILEKYEVKVNIVANMNYNVALGG
ncbi:hypothetical protein CNR22_16885 [Sphingobacteriaceae bacterium]|nr:hypothetical protein CNR22_16885 [Sphingobacteriaceae bacterium]